MNHIFRVIWNRTLRLWQCVSEKVKSTTKAGPNAAKTASGMVTASVAGAGVALALLMPPTPGVAAASLELTQAWMDNFYNTTDFYSGYNGDAKPIQGYGGNGNSGSNRWRFVLDNLELESLHVAADEVIKTGHIMPRFVGEHSTLTIDGTWIAGVNQQTIASWSLWTDSNRHDTVVTGLLVAGHASGGDEFYDVNTERVRYTSNSRLESNHLLLGDFSSTNPATQETFTVKGSGKVLVENVLSVYTYVPSPPDRFLSAISGRFIPQLVPSSGASFTINLEENGVIDAAGLKFGQGFNVNNAHASVTFNQTGAGSRLEISTARGIERVADTDLGRNPPGTRGDLSVTMNFNAGEMRITRPKGTYTQNKRVLFNGFNTDANLTNRDKVVFGESATDTYTLNLDGGVTVSQYRYAGFEGQGTIVKGGYGAWVLTADNSRFTGTLQIDEGTIAIGGYGWNYTSTFYNPFSRSTDRTLLNDAGFKTTGTPTTLPNPLPSARAGQDWQFGGRVKVNPDGTLEYSPVGDHAFNSSAAKMTFNWDTEVESNGIVRIFTYDDVNLLGKHTYGEYGQLMINSGHVTLTGTGEIAGEGNLSIGDSAQGYRYSPTYYPGASLTLLGTDKATVDFVEIAAGGDGSLILDHSTLTLNYLVHGWWPTYKATFEMKNDSTLRIGGTTDRADPRQLFRDFNTASGQDTISSVGDNRLNVTGYVEQVANAGFSGSGTLTKAGDGTLIISANNDRFEGTWVVADGVLQWGNNVDLNGANAPTLNNGTVPAVKLTSEIADAVTDRYQGTFAFGHSGTYTLDSDFFGDNTEAEKTGNLRMAGTGTLVVTGAQSYKGQTQIYNGTISLQGTNTLSDLLGQSASAIDTGVSDTEKGVLEIRRAQADDEFDRLITGKGSFTKAGSGTVTLTGGSQEDGDFYDYEGNTAVRGGELVLETGKKIDSATGGAASNVLVGAEEGMTSATFTIKGSAKVGGSVILADHAAAGSMNTVHVTEHAKLSAGKVQRDTTATDADAALRLSGMGMLELTASTGENDRLFDEFQTDGDRVEIGTGGGVIAVTGDNRQTQNKAAAIVDAADSSNQHLVKAGTGTLVLTAENTYSGYTIVANGTLQLGDALTDTVANTALGGTSDIILGNHPDASYEITLHPEVAQGTTKGTLSLALGGNKDTRADDLVLERKVTGHGDLVQQGTNTVVINRVHDYDGDTKVLGGVLSLRDGGQLGTSTAAIITGKLDEEGAQPGMFEIRMENDDSLPNGTFDRLITGDGGFTKAGSSTATLDASANRGNTYDYTGDTKVVGGKLILASGMHITKTANLYVGSETADSQVTFTIKGSATVKDQVKLGADAKSNTMNRLELDGSILNAGNILKAVPASGVTEVRVGLAMKEGATVTITGDEDQTGVVEKALFANFDTREDDTITIGHNGAKLAVEANLKVIQNANAVISDDQEDGNRRTTHSLTKEGEGTLVLTANNTYSGTVTVATGVLQVGDENSDPRTTQIGGSGLITVNGGATFAVGFGEASTGDVAYHLGGTDVDGQERLITGGGNVMQVGSGTTIVDRNHTYTGQTIIRGGTLQLQLNKTTQLGSRANQTAVDTGSATTEGAIPAGSGTFELYNDGSAGDQRWDRAIEGMGHLKKTGSGKVTLNATSDNVPDVDLTYSGNTVVAAGTLVLAHGMHITQTENLLVGAETAGASASSRSQATFTIEGSATVRDKVQLGAGAKSHTMNTLELAGSQLDAANIVKVTEENTEDVKATLLMHHGSTVTITKTQTEATSGSTDPLHKALFTGFDTTATGGDQLLIGAGGTNFKVNEGIIAEQSANAAISNMADEGNHDLTKQGAGTLVLAAKNTFTGKVTVESGTLQVGNLGKVEDTTLGGKGEIEVAAGANFAVKFQAEDDAHAYRLGGTGTDGLKRKIVGAGNVIQLGEGTTIVDQAHTYSGNTLIRGGTLRLMDDGQLGTGTTVVDTGSATMTGLIEAGSGTFEIQANNDRTWTRGITGTGNFTKSGSGLVRLTGDGPLDFEGKMLVTNGILEVGENHAVSKASEVTVAASAANTQATLRLDRGSSVPGDITLGTGTSTNTMTNVLDVNGAVLDVKRIKKAMGSQAASQLIIRNTALLNVTAGSTLFEGFAGEGDHVYVGKDGGTLSIANGLAVTQDANAALIDWTDASNVDHETEDSITKSGTGTLILNAKNTYSGQLTIDAGTLQLGAEGATARTAMLGGTGEIAMGENTTLILNVADGEAGAAVQGRDEKTVVNAQGQLVLDRAITGAGGSLVQKGSGTTILLGANTYAGTTTIEHGVLQIGNALRRDGRDDSSVVALGGTGEIKNDGRLVFSLASATGGARDLTLERLITGTGALEQHGVGELFVKNAANAFTGNVYVTTGTLRTQQIGSLGRGKVLVLGEATDEEIASVSAPASSGSTNADSTDSAEGAETAAAADTPYVSSSTPVARRLMARNFARLAAVAPDPIALTTGTYIAEYDTDTTWDRAIVGTGNFMMTGKGKLTFTTNHQYLHRGTTTLANKDGWLIFDKDVGMPNSALSIEQGTLTGDVNVHHFAALTVASGTDPQVYIVMKDSNDYTQFWNTGDVNIQGGKLFVDVSHYDADKSENFPGNWIRDVIKSDTTLVGANEQAVHQFVSYEDTSTLFNFKPVYDYEGKAVHLYVESAAADAEACRNAGMGKVECIVREYGHDFLANLAKVADKEFAENPMGIVAQYFYSISTNERVDAAAVRGAPLMTGSMNQTLQHDAQNLAAYAPRDPCDPTVTEHGHNLWAKFEQSWDSQEALRGSTGYRGRHSTIAVGKDVCVKDNSLRLGAFVGYTDSSIKSHGNVAMHNAKTDLYQIGLYGDKVTAENRDVDFQVGYGRGRVEGHRNLLLFTADSKYDANILYAGVGYNWRGDIVSPFVRFDYTYVRSDAYEETGAKVFNYNVKAQDHHSGIVQAGYRFDIKPEGKPYQFYGRVGVGYELLDKYNTITAAFQGIPNAYFDTRSAEDSRLMGLFDFGMNYKASDRVDFNLNYHLTAKPDYRDHGGQVAMTVHF